MKREGEDRLYGFLAEARHLNRGGVVHGGMLMAFADQTLGMAASRANGGRRQVTVQLDTHFLATVRQGEFVVSHCTVERLTRSLVFMRCELKAGARTVATASGIWKLLGA
ncbi:PaaI family thioesterase [Enterovirga aerilata]|nr:PaaI family thioesterase [Enterovirga sp. DB1703]